MDSSGRKSELYGSSCERPARRDAVHAGAAALTHYTAAMPAIVFPSRHVVQALIAICVLAAATAPAQAQWKWRDANGQITASDRPPPKDIPDKDILGRPASSLRRAAAAAAAPASAASGVVAAASTPLDAEVEARRRASEQQASAKARADEERLAAQRADNCRRARGHLAALESGQRIARTNERGEREVLDDKGRADEMRQARAVITSDCGARP